MSQVEVRLGELLRQAAPSAQAVSFEKVASRARRRALRRRASASAAAAALAAAVAVAGVAASGPGSRASGPGPAAAAGARNLAGGWGRLRPLGPPPLAVKTTVAGAQARAGYPVPLPSVPAASRANLTQVWVNRHDGEVALVFDRGKVDITMHRTTYQSALGYFRTFVAEKNLNRVTAAIGKVSGRPALVITPNTDAYTHANPAVVSFWRDGVFISVYSDTYGTGALLSIAGSMR